MSETEAIDTDWEFPVDPDRLSDLWKARRNRRIAEIHWVDALYKVYVSALLVLAAVLISASAIGDERLNPRQLDELRTNGPAIAALAAAFAVVIGLRSGSRGGPLALAAADVRHVLLAPISRAAALRPLAWRQLRFGLFSASSLGAITGYFASRRLPGPTWGWPLAGSAAGAVLVALALGSAMAASGFRVRRVTTSLIGLVLVGWALADAAGKILDGAPVIPASPARVFGTLVLAPAVPDFGVAAVAVVVFSAGLVALGLVNIGGLSVESAERRTALVGQMRFAATLQDVRTVLVLRRQLAADRPRRSPWLPVPGFFGPVNTRALKGLVRFPAARLVRMTLLAGLAGATLRLVWADTAPAIVLVGLSFWLIGLDLVEPMAQEVDRPSLRQLYPHEEGTMLVGLLRAPMFVSVLFALVGAAAASFGGPSHMPFNQAAAVCVVAMWAALAGAALNAYSGAPSSSVELTLMAPEVAGIGTVAKSLLPLVIAVIGVAPVLVIEANLRAGRPWDTGMWLAQVAVLSLCGLAVGWIHQRNEIMGAWQSQLEAAGAGKRVVESDEEEDLDDD